MRSSIRTKVAQVAQTFPLKLAGDSTAGGETVLGTTGPFHLDQMMQAEFSHFASQLGTGSAHRRAQPRRASPLPLAGGPRSLLKEEQLINKNCVNWENWGPTFATAATDSERSFVPNESFLCRSRQFVLSNTPGN